MIKHLKIIFLLSMLISTVRVAGQSCPPPSSLGSIMVNPPKASFCQGDNINCNFAPAYPMVGSVSWSYDGTYGSDSPSGPSNTIDDVFGLQTTGNIIATGMVMVGGSNCSFSVSSLVLVTTADAGANMAYMPGYTSITIGAASPCMVNGTAPFTESWLPTTYMTGSTSNCKAIVDGQVANTIYTISITDANCMSSDTVLITLACPPSVSIGSLSASPSQTLYCNNSSITGSMTFTNSYFVLQGNVAWAFTGSPSLTASGTGSVNYAISNLASSGTLSTRGTVKLSAGTLTCSFSSSLGINVDNVQANVGANLSYTPGVSSPLTLGASTCASAGTSPYTQTWTPTTFFTSTTYSSICQPTVSNLTSNTIYSLKVTDSPGCSSTNQMTVTLACPTPSTIASITGSPSVLCIHGNATGTLNVSNTSFSLTGNVTWSYSGTPSITSSGSNLRNYTITNLLTAGMVSASGSVQVTGGSLVCPFTASLTPVVNSLTANAGTDKTYVPGMSAVTIGTAVCAGSGTPTYIYSWSPTIGLTPPTNSCNVAASNLSNTATYDLTVQDTYCTVTDQMSITLACPPTNSIISIVPSQSIQCLNGNSTGSLSLLNSAFTLTGNATWGYTGTPSVTASGTNLSHFAINGLLTAGTLTAGGSAVVSGGTLVCTYSAQVTLTLSTLTANAGIDKVYVPGTGSITIGTSGCASGGNPAYSYSWSPITGLTPPTNSCMVAANNLSNTATYDLTVQDASCTATDQMIVTLACPSASSMASIVPGSSVQCIHGNSTGSLSITNVAFTPTGNATWGYSGTPSVGSSGANLFNYSIFGLLTAGTLTVGGNIVVSGGALVCPYTAQVSFSPAISTLSANAGFDGVFIPGAGTITMGVLGCGISGNPGYTYSWSPSTDIVGAANSCTFQINNLSTDLVYTLTVYDTNCNASDEMTVTLTCPSPASIASISLSPVQPVYCPGSNLSGTISSASFNASAPVSWSYSGTNSVAASGTNSVNFSITGLQSSGIITASGTMQIIGGTLTCPFTATTQINESTLSADAGAPQAWSSGGITAYLGGSACGAGTSYSYTSSWSPTTGLSNGSICNPSITGVTATVTIYTLTVTDPYCTASSTVSVFLVGAVTNNKNYAILKKELDAGYFNSIKTSTTNILYFKFDEEYYAPPGTTLTYKLYNDSGADVTPSSPPTEVIGDNRYAISVSGITAGYYRLNVYNQKNELWQSRVKIN